MVSSSEFWLSFCKHTGHQDVNDGVELRMSDKPDVLFLRERQIAVFTAFIITKSNIILV